MGCGATKVASAEAPVQAPVREEKQSAVKPKQAEDQPAKDPLHKAAGAVVAVAKYQCEALLCTCKLQQVQTTQGPSDGLVVWYGGAGIAVVLQTQMSKTRRPSLMGSTHLLIRPR